MREFAVTIPQRGTVKVLAPSAYEAVLEVLDALNLRYVDTNFRVSELVPLAQALTSHRTQTANPQALA